MSMKTTTSQPLSVADIQRALRPPVYASKRAPQAVEARRSPSRIDLNPEPLQGPSPAPLLADMLDQARVHTAVLRTLLADAVAEEDAARARVDDTRRKAQDLWPLLDHTTAAGTTAATLAKALTDAAERAATVADRLSRLMATGEALADDLRTRQVAEFDRQTATFAAAITQRSAAALAEHAQRFAVETAGTLETLNARIAAAKAAQSALDGRITTLSEHAADLPAAIAHLERLLAEARASIGE